MITQADSISMLGKSLDWSPVGARASVQAPSLYGGSHHAAI